MIGMNVWLVCEGGVHKMNPICEYHSYQAEKEFGKFTCRIYLENPPDIPWLSISRIKKVEGQKDTETRLIRLSKGFQQCPQRFKTLVIYPDYWKAITAMDAVDLNVLALPPSIKESLFCDRCGLGPLENFMRCESQGKLLCRGCHGLN